MTIERQATKAPETKAPETKAPTPSRASSILKNAAALLLGQVTTNVLSLLVIVYVPRRIGPNGMGELTIASTITALVATVLTLGISTVMVRDIARDHDKGPDMIGAALLIRILMALPTLVVIGVIIWLTGYSPETQVLIVIMSVSMIINLLLSPFQSGFQAFERMKFNSLSGIISEIIVGGASVAIVLAGGGVILIALVNVLASLVIMFLTIRWWRSFGAVRLRFNFKLMRYLIVGGLPFWATGLFFTIYLYVDSWMLSKMTNAIVVGWYSVPTNLFGFLLFIPTILGTAMFPAMARAYKQAPREMVKMARRSFNLITCVSLPMAVGGLLLSKPIILTLYGAEFAASIPVLTVLSVMVVPTYLNILVNQFLMATGRQVAWTKVMAGACIVNPLLNLVLINFYQQRHQNGAYGAAWALLLTEGIMAVVGIVLLPRGILGWNNVVSIAKSTAAAGLMALGVWYTQNYFLPIPIATGVIVYAGAVLLLGVLPREEWGMFVGIAMKVLNKLGLSGKFGLPQADAKIG